MASAGLAKLPTLGVEEEFYMVETRTPVCRPLRDAYHRHLRRPGAIR